MTCEQCNGTGKWHYGDGQSTEVCPLCRDYVAASKPDHRDETEASPELMALAEIVRLDDVVKQTWAYTDVCAVSDAIQRAREMLMARRLP